MPVEEALKQLESSFSGSQNANAISLAAYLIIGGCLAIYVRMLYRRCSTTASDSDSFTRVFPLLTLVTTGVIAVVKSSLALSLGLVGALSIVRFRAAIKEPEELVYLFLCIAIGLALGAELPMLAIVMVVVATIFAVAMSWASRTRKAQNLLLTITGDSDRYFTNEASGVMAVVEEVAGDYTLQRLDIQQQRGQARLVLGKSSPQETASIIARLRERLPDCEMSYVNLNSNL